MSFEKKRFIERTNHSGRLYYAALENGLRYSDDSTILDVGAGDSNFAAMMAEDHNARVIRVDSDYDVAPPTGDDYLVADARDLSAIESSSVDMAVSMFLMQHLNPEDQYAAIKEMIRVTKYASPISVGAVGIFPVYRPQRLKSIENDSRFKGVLGIYDSVEDMKHLPLYERQNFSSLWIRKNKDTPDDTIDELIFRIAESGALKRRKTIADLARRSLMRANGTNIADVR